LEDTALVTGVETKDLEKRLKAKEDKTVIRNKTTTSALKSTATTSVVAKQNIKDLNLFVKNASPAQIAQVRMIRQIFEQMDIDKDGVLSFDDVRRYFISKGRNESEVFIRKWISSRDIDQDGAVSLLEYISSFTPQFDLGGGLSKTNLKDLDKASEKVSPITLAFGKLRAGSTARDTMIACDEIIERVQKIIQSPQIQEYRVIFTDEERYKAKVGRLIGGLQLLLAFGFKPENNAAMLTLRDELGKDYEVVPHHIVHELRQKVEELSSHRQSLGELAISNVAAGR
jgi:hypothetical protein